MDEETEISISLFLFILFENDSQKWVDTAYGWNRAYGELFELFLDVRYRWLIVILHQNEVVLLKRKILKLNSERSQPASRYRISKNICKLMNAPK